MTRFNNKYPYTDFHELNADWLLETVKDAADTVDGYDARLTSAEGAITTLQSEVETAGTGLLDRVTAAEGDIDALEADVNTPSTGLKARMTAAEGDIDTLQNEVETPSTGLLDRVTALENAPAPSANAVYYLEFDSSLVSIDPDNAYDSRIEYDWLKQFVPLNTSGEDTHVIKLYDSHTQKVYDLAGFHLQESVSPDGIFVFTNRAEHLTGGVIDYYVNSTVMVSQNATNPTFAEENEIVLPVVTSADAGDVLTVDGNGDWVAAAPSVLPVVTAADAGDVLTVDNNGDWVAATPGETRTPITVTPNLGGITILNNRSYYTDKDIVIDVYVNTTLARTGAYILAISSTTLTALNSILPIDVNEIDTNSYTAITGCGGSLSLYDANDEWINVTCPAAGLLHIYGVYAKAV